MYLASIPDVLISGIRRGRTRNRLTFAAVCVIVMAVFLQGAFGQFHWTRCPQNPVMPGESLLGWDSHHVLHPSVIHKDGIYHMWYRGWSEYWVGTMASIGYAISIDGVKWFRYARNPVITGEFADWTNKNADNPAVSLIDGQYVMLFNTGTYGKHIGLATSQDGMTWSTYPNPVISVGDSGAWDGYALDGSSSIIKWQGTYWTWYVGLRSTGGSIGVATSTNLTDWSKSPDSPVLTPGDSSSWERTSVTGPEVFLCGDRLEMLYAGASGERQYIGRAVSEDGIHWTKAHENPVFLPGDPGSWDSTRVGAPSVVISRDRFLMWYAGGNGYDWRVGLATSPIPHDLCASLHESVQFGTDTAVTGARVSDR